MKKILYIIISLFIISCDTTSSDQYVVDKCSEQIENIFKSGTEITIENVSEFKIIFYPKGYEMYDEIFDSLNIQGAATTMFIKDDYINANSYHLTATSKEKSDSIIRAAKEVLSQVPFKHIGYRYNVSGYATLNGLRAYFESDLYSDLNKDRFSHDGNITHQLIKEIVSKDSLCYYIDQILDTDKNKYIRMHFNLE